MIPLAWPPALHAVDADSARPPASGSFRLKHIPVDLVRSG